MEISTVLSKLTCAPRSVKRFKTIPNSLVTLLLIGAPLFAGCTTLYDPETSQDIHTEIIAQVQDQQPFGQTFISRRPTINGIDLWLSIDPNAQTPDGILYFDLFDSPDDPNPILTVPLSSNQIRNNYPTRVSFQPLDRPPNQTYYFELRTGASTVRVHGRSEDVHPSGSGMLNGIPYQADAAYRLYYDYDFQAFMGDLQTSFPKLWWLIAALALLLFPGWLILDLLDIGKHFDNIERIALSAGMSLAAIPILMTWTTQVNLPWNQTVILVGFIGITILTGWRFIKSYKLKISTYQITSPYNIRICTRPEHSQKLTFLLILLIFIGALGVRLVMVRDLAASPWVDSVHHATITRLILEQGVFPDTYQPLVEVDNASYHTGLHATLATFLWLSHLDIRTGMLFFCQVINALSIFAVYLFTRKTTDSRAAGIIAAFLTGFVSPMPAYYTSWGRYTQLAGLLIFPVAMTLVFLILDPGCIKNKPLSEHPFKWLLGAAITFAGLVMTHYRVAAFLVCLLTIWLVWPKYRRIGNKLNWLFLGSQLGRLVIIGGLSGFLLSPWLPSMLTKMILPRINSIVPNAPKLFSDFSWGYLTSGYGYVTLLLAGMGIIIGIITRKKFSVVFPIWVGILFFLANLGALRLPGNSLINNTSVEIALFIPISASGGYLVAQVIQSPKKFLPRGWVKLYMVGVLFLGVYFAFIGARKLAPILNPITFLFREADVHAIQWIEKNIPEEATVLINPFAWGYGLYAGNDGGYWITPLAGRKTMPPPLLYGFDNNKENINKIVEISQKVIELKDDLPAIHTLLSEEKIDYIYLGRRGGVLSAKSLYESPLFETLYQENGVWIYKLR